jgi:hypothetical protein
MYIYIYISHYICKYIGTYVYMYVYMYTFTVQEKTCRLREKKALVERGCDFVCLDEFGA